MARATKVIRNFYRDSVSLMQLSSTFAKLPGVEQASVIMASANNVNLLMEAGLLAEMVEAGANDLLIALQGNADALDGALEAAESALKQPAPTAEQGTSHAIPPRSLEMGLADMVEANLALISTPGEYAASEAFKALRLGLNVMLFSDNVELADEIALKRFARDHDLIVMGPDCGTAVINGIPLAFANAVKRGAIGVVAASGTGLQQVTCLIDRWGQGISRRSRRGRIHRRPRPPDDRFHAAQKDDPRRGRQPRDRRHPDRCRTGPRRPPRSRRRTGPRHPEGGQAGLRRRWRHRHHRRPPEPRQGRRALREAGAHVQLTNVAACKLAGYLAAEVVRKNR
jgi:hypothetical protein